MLKEVTSPRQWPNESDRRVFIDPYFDLFVWTSLDGTISRFQLGYDKMGKPRAFEWLDGSLFHYQVDSGQDDSHTRVNMTAVLIADPSGDPAQVASALNEVGIESNPAVLEFVVARLRGNGELQRQRCDGQRA